MNTTLVRNTYCFIFGFAFWLSEEVLSYVLWDSRVLSHNYFLSTAYFLYMQSNLKTKYRPAITFKIILTYSLPMV